jgi:hypothetical protein
MVNGVPTRAQSPQSRQVRPATLPPGYPAPRTVCFNHNEAGAVALGHDRSGAERNGLRFPRSPATKRPPAGAAPAVLKNAVAWFADRGVTLHRALSDNGSCYKSHLWRGTCAELGITPKKTRPHRPQTNGKIERFHRTLAEGRAFKKF